MTDETELETALVTADIANAKADMALRIITRLFQELFQKGIAEQTMTQLASANFIEENEESDPAAALALMELRNEDPDDPFDANGVRIKEHMRLRKKILENIRRNHQNVTK